MPFPTVVLGAVRTPWARLLGSLSDVSAIELGAAAVRAALKRAGIGPEAVQHVVLGNVLADGTSGHPAGAVCRAAGLPEGISSLTLRSGCASGLAAIAAAVDAVASGRAEVALAGGFESSSRAPHLATGLRSGLRLGSASLRDSARHDGPVAGDPAPDEDRRRHAQADREGRLGREIAPVLRAKPPKGQEPETATDDPPGSGAPLPALADGAAMLVLATAAWAEARGIQPLCRLSVSAEPLNEAGSHDQIHADLPSDGWAALAGRDGRRAPASINPSGGGAALGHAAGADGARLAVSMAHALAGGEAASALAIAGGPFGALVGVSGRR